MFHGGIGVVCSSLQLLMEEEDHLKQALQRCKYPAWALNRAKIKHNKSKRSNKGFNNIMKSPTSNNNNPHIMVPYIKGLSESCKTSAANRSFKSLWWGWTIKDLLVNPTDRDTILQKCGVIYRYKCGRVDCEEEYIGVRENICRKTQRTHEGYLTHPLPITMPLVMTYLLTTIAL